MGGRCLQIVCLSNSAEGSKVTLWGPSKDLAILYARGGVGVQAVCARYSSPVLEVGWVYGGCCLRVTTNGTLTYVPAVTQDGNRMHLEALWRKSLPNTKKNLPQSWPGNRSRFRCGSGFMSWRSFPKRRRKNFRNPDWATGRGFKTCSRVMSSPTATPLASRLHVRSVPCIFIFCAGREDPFHVRFPPLDYSTTTARDISQITKLREISAGVHVVHLYESRQLFVFEEVERPQHLPEDTAILQRELRNLEQLPGSMNVVRLVAAVSSTNPYRTSVVGVTGTPRLARLSLGAPPKWYCIGCLTITKTGRWPAVAPVGASDHSTTPLMSHCSYGHKAI